MTTKSPNHPSMRKRTADAASTIHPLTKKFIDDLVASGSAKVLTKEESAALIADTEFDGCIARPKNSAASTK